MPSDTPRDAVLVAASILLAALIIVAGMLFVHYSP